MFKQIQHSGEFAVSILKPIERKETNIVFAVRQREKQI